jgi:hypothetical protein
MKHSELVFGYGSASFIDAESALIFFVGGLFLYLESDGKNGLNGGYEALHLNTKGWFCTLFQHWGHLSSPWCCLKATCWMIVD